MTVIDRTSPVPIYHQLKTLIEGQIKNGTLRPGDRIPTERELCQAHGISRSPVRQALNELAREGLLIRRPGLGTFVANHASGGASDEISVRMMCSDAGWCGVLDHVSGVWNARYPDRAIRFDVQVVPHGEFYDLLSAAVGRGTAPDLAVVDSVWVAGLANAGFLHVLENLGSPWDRRNFGKDLYPTLIDANSLDERLYGVPVKADVSLLWYRRDWFTNERLTPPTDWANLLDVATHFLQPDVQRRYGLGYPLTFPGGTAGGEATVYNLMPFIWSAGGEIFDADAGRVSLNSPGTRRALAYLRTLVHRHHVSSPDGIGYGYDTSPKLFAAGKAAMALGGSYEADFIRSTSSWSAAEFRSRVGTVVPPAAPGCEPVSTIGGTSYVILRQCDRPDLVTDLLRMATDPNVIGDLYRSMWLNLPRPSFNAMLGRDSEPLLAQVARLIASGRARPPIPEYFRVSRQLQAMFEAAIFGSEPVEDITERSAEFISILTELPC